MLRKLPEISGTEYIINLSIYCFIRLLILGAVDPDGRGFCDLDQKNACVKMMFKRRI